MNILNTMINIIRDTPLWVWVLLVFLLIRGISALKTRIVSLHSIFLVPTLFVVITLTGLYSPHFIKLSSIAVWTSSLLLGSVAGWLMFVNVKILADKKKKLLQLPGSALIFYLTLVIFGLKYYFGYTRAVNPSLAMSESHMTLELALFALIAGTVVGRMLCLIYQYWCAAHTNLEK